MLYTIDEIISSVERKPIFEAFEDAPSDTVDPKRYLIDLLGTDQVRRRKSIVPLEALQILQPQIELWRYLRLCSLRENEFMDLSNRLPIVVVRGHGIQGYPLLQGNHRALFALMHNIPELKAEIFILGDKEASFSFMSEAERQSEVLRLKYGQSGVGALREAYKRILSRILYLRQRDLVFMKGNLFTTRAGAFRELRTENEAVSHEIPCISMEGLIQTLQKMFQLRRGDLRFSLDTRYFRGLILTQGGIERDKLARIASTPRLLEAPILVVRTRILDYVAAGHTRLRALLEGGRTQVRAIHIHVENDDVNRFFTSQAEQSGYRFGNEGIRRLTLI